MALITTPPARPVLLTTEFDRDGITFERVTAEEPGNVVRVWQATTSDRHLVLTEDLSDFAAGRVVWEVMLKGGRVTVDGTVWAGRGKHADLDAVDALGLAADLAIQVVRDR